jgi:hypothetical protein
LSTAGATAPSCSSCGRAMLQNPIRRLGLPWFCSHCAGGGDPRPRAGSYHAKLEHLVQRSKAADLTDPLERYHLRASLQDLVEVLHDLDREEGR